MKKNLEVLRNGENDIRFNTEINLSNNLVIIPDIMSSVTFAMATKLWGGNETDVLAMIRLLYIADLSLSSNREGMLKRMGEEAEIKARSLRLPMAYFKRAGGYVGVFSPNSRPSDKKS